MICQHCGATIPDDSHFCTYCGVSFNLADPPAYKLNLGKLLSDTFTLYGRHFGIMGIIGLIYIGITVIFDVCGILTGYPVFFALLEPIVQCYVMVVMFRQCLYTARGGIGLERNLMSSSLGMFLPMFGLNLVFGCIILVCMLPVLALASIIFGVLGQSEVAWFFFTCCTIGVLPLVCYPLTRLWLAPVFLVDRNEGVFASIENTWQISSGNFWTLFVGIIVFFTLPICSVIACGSLSEYVLEWDTDLIPGTLLVNAGLIPIIAIFWLGSVLAYLQLTGQPNCLDEPR